MTHPDFAGFEGHDMRIVHVVTLVTPDAAYGGPVRVAVNQLKELASRGHSVTLIAGWHADRDISPPTEIDGVPVRLFPVRRLIPHSGFVGMFSFGLLRWLSECASMIDVAHIHLSRDLIPTTAGLMLLSRSVPVVLQSHGMVVESPRRSVHAIDAIMVRRLLAKAAVVYFLTRSEQQSLQVVARRHITLERLRNGVPRPTPDDMVDFDVEEKLKAPEVLFMARLHERKRPDVFVKAAVELALTFPHARFSLVGPDEGMASIVTTMIEESGLSDRITWEGALDPDCTLRRMRSASIYALPSVNEPFPMSVLEALSVGLPVIMTDSCGLADDIIRGDAGLVTDSTQKSFTDSLRKLLSDNCRRDVMGCNARKLAAEDFDLAPIVDALERKYMGIHSTMPPLALAPAKSWRSRTTRS